ncbi:MAG: O-antigen ligase family protein [Candidatus Omnitrophica bacterium]|nr:O-antigen ligase family protein [Candidatus Omnitrophota bacterium]
MLRKLWPLYLFLLFLPLDLRASFLPGYWGEKIRLTDLSFLILCLFWFIQSIQKPRLPVRPPLLFALLLVFFTASLSLIGAIDLSQGFVQLAGLGYLIALYFILTDLMQDQQTIRNVIKFWIAIQTLIALLSLISWLIHFAGIPSIMVIARKEYSTLLPPRIKGFCFSPNSFALQTHIAIIFAFAFWLEKRDGLEQTERTDKDRWTFPSLIGLTLANILCVSRLILGTLISVCAILRRAKEPWCSPLRKGIIASLFLLGIAAWPLTLWTVMPVKIHHEVKGDDSFLSLQWNSSRNFYFLNAKASLQMVLDHPWFGVGIGNFRPQLINYFPHYKIDSHKLYGGPGRLSHHLPHQFYGGWAAQTGIVGLAAMLFFLGGFLRKSLNAVEKSGDYVTQAIWATAIGFMVQGFLNDLIFERSFWLFLAIAVSWLRTLELKKIL